jgi:4-amino-4-deoxy-L-arabinose transferase-like glycosyltransferase
MLKRLQAMNPAVWLTLIGAIFRFAELGSVRITHDLAWQGWEAARIVNGVYPLLGQPSSVFLDNPSLMGYIQAIPLFFWRSPWSIFIFITMLNTQAIPFLYSAVDKTLGRRIAILATFLFAINPWIVHFSRMTWTQGLLPFFLAIMFWGWVPVLVRQGRDVRTTAVRLPENGSANVSPLPTTDHRIANTEYRFLAGWVAFTAMCMTYVLAFAMFAPVGLLMVIFWKRLPKREFAAGVCILAVTLMFYGWAVAQNLDQNSGKFFSFLDDVGQTEQRDESSQLLNLTDDALVHAMRFVTGRDFVVRDVNGATTEGPIPVPIMAQLARWGLTAAFLAGLIHLLLKRNGVTWVLLIWFFVPIGLMMILPSSVFVHPHYLLFTLPAGGIIAAIGLDWGMQKHQFAVWGVIILLLAIGVQFKVSLWQNGQVTQESPFARGLDGLPLSTAAELGAHIRTVYADSTGYEPLRISSKASDQIMSATSGLWLDSMSELAPPDWVMLPNKQRILYIDNVSRPFLDVEPSAVSKPFDRISIYLFEPEAGLAIKAQEVVEQESEAGFTFLGFSKTVSDENRLVVQTYWRVDTLHDARNEWFVSPFVHLLNAEGQTVVNVAPHGQWGYRWRVGDVYVSTVTLDRPADAVKLGIGLFDPISGRTFMLNGPDGNVPRFEAGLP